MSSNRTKYSEEMREQTAIFILEDASGHKMVSEMQEFSVKGQEIMLKTEEKENIQ